MESRPVGETSGFVLTGGTSSRMGRDKARLPFHGGTLVEHVAECVRAAAGSVTLVGAPERYGGLGLAALADHYTDCGPLGGICTALEITSADWNLIVACDMPGVTAEFLGELVEAARKEPVDAVVPEAPHPFAAGPNATAESGTALHPLCAVYHRRVLPVALRQIRNKSLKMHDFLAALQIAKLPAAAIFVENVNTPLDWASR